MVYFIVLAYFLIFLTLFAVIILFVRQNRLFHIEKKYRRLNEELEETMSAFLIQIKEENERLIEKAVSLDQKPEKNTGEIIENRVNKYRLHSGIQEYKKNAGIIGTDDGKKAPDNMEKAPVSEYEEEINKIKQLLESGYTIEEIAKQLEKGKTEVELLIKFSGNLNGNKKGR